MKRQLPGEKKAPRSTARKMKDTNSHNFVNIHGYRRHNKDSHHTATIQLASAGTIAGFDVDTSFFDVCYATQK